MEEDYPTKTFEVKNGRILNTFDGHAAIVQAVDKILKTDRFVYPIYDDQYGNDFEELFGKDYDYVKVEVERMLKEALLDDTRISSVEINTIEKIDKNILVVSGNCETVYGSVPIESEVKLSDS